MQPVDPYPAARRPLAPRSAPYLAPRPAPFRTQHPAPYLARAQPHDLQLYLLSDSKDSVSLFDLASGTAIAPPATADRLTCSQWLTRDAVARLAIRNHLPLAECTHFGQHRTAPPPSALPVPRAVRHRHSRGPGFPPCDARYRAAVHAEFLDRNPPPMDHFLSLDPTSLTVDFLEQHLLTAETSEVAVGAARGTPHPPFFKGCSPSPLAPFYASAAAADVSVAEDVSADSASAKRRSSKGKGGRGGGGGRSGGGGGSRGSGGGSSGGGGGDGTGGGVGALMAAVEAAVGVASVVEVGLVAVGLALGVSVLGVASVSSSSVGVRPRLPNFDAILSAMYALSVSAVSDCYQCVPPDPGIAAAALGASESDTLRGTTPAEALHTFTLDSGDSRCFFRDNTTLTPLPAPVPVRLADPSGGPVVARSSTVLLCPAVPSGSLSGLHLPSFSTNLVSTAALQDAMVTTTTHGGPRVSICTCTRTGRHLATSGSRLLLVLPPVALCRQVRQRAAPHSSSFPPTIAPLQTPHMDVWGPARDFCHGEGILQSFMLPDSLQQNGIAECRIGLVMEVAHTSMIHAAAPHFLWPFAVQYAAHQLSLWPRVSLQETSPTLRWTGKVGDASVFRFYHPTSRRVFSSQDVMFDELVPFYRLFPYRSTPPPPPPLFLAPDPPPVDPLPPQCPAPSGVSQVDPLPGPAPVKVAVGSGAARGAASRGAASGGAASEGAEPGGAESEGAESGVDEPGDVETRCVEAGGSAGASPRLSPQQLREWFVRRARLRRGATGAGGAGVAAGAGVTVAGDPTESGAAGAGGSGAGGAGAGGAGVGGTGAGGAGFGGPSVGGTGAGGAGAIEPGGAVRPRPYFVPLLQQVLGTPSSIGLTHPLLCPPPDQSQPPLQPTSPLLAPSPYAEQSGVLTKRREPASCPVSPVRTAPRVPRLRPPPVPGTHAMTLRPSSVPLRVPLPAPPESSLPEVPDPESDRACAASPTVSRLLATDVTDPLFESAAASSLVAELLDFAAACRLDYAIALVAQSASASPSSIGGECGLGIDVLEDRVKRPPGSPPAFKARYVARGFSQRQGVYYFHTFSPTSKMTTLQVLLHVAAQRTQWSLRQPVYGLFQAPYEWHDTLRTTLAALGFAPSTVHQSLFLRTDTSLSPFYVLVYVDNLVFATADTEALTLVKSFSISASSSPRHSPLLCLPATHSELHLQTSPTSGMGLVLGGWGPVVLTGHADASWVDDSATQRLPLGYTFSLGSGSVSRRSTRSSSFLSSTCEAEIYAGAMAAQELRWLTYVLTKLGEQPRLPPVLCEAEIYAGAMAALELRWLTYLGEQPRWPPVLYVDNKAMISLCQEHKLEHRTKHIALRYFLARELQKHGQLRLAYVATRANTADIFTKALQPSDCQRFVTVLGLVPTLPHLLTP
ncbi:unnamed protein product [Closterium sp. NIES-53]